MDLNIEAKRIAEVWPDAFKDGQRCKLMCSEVTLFGGHRIIARRWLQRGDGTQHDITETEMQFIKGDWCGRPKANNPQPKKRRQTNAPLHRSKKHRRRSPRRVRG